MTTTSPPFFLPPLENPYVQPVPSTSTKGLIHLVIFGTYDGEPYEFCTGSLRSTNGPHCGLNCVHVREVREQL